MVCARSFGIPLSNFCVAGKGSVLLCLMSGVELPIHVARTQVPSALQLIVQTNRFADGGRRISHISQCRGLDSNGQYLLEDIYRLLRRGKISLLTLTFLVFMVVLMGMLGNTGHAVNQKLAMQNAADSIAFSSSMWLARGMNTVTASNPLVGEVAAISVIHESLGGSELRLGLKKNTAENRQLDQVLQGLKLSAPIGRVPSPYVRHH